jgi:hypothetical protein
VDGHLVADVHLVKLVNAADALRARAPKGSRQALQPAAHAVQQPQGAADSSLLPLPTLSASIRAPASMKNSLLSLSLTTAAVRPAAVEALPEV